MDSVDDLIGELFPKKAPAAAQPTTTSEWDAPSSEEQTPNPKQTTTTTTGGGATSPYVDRASSANGNKNNNNGGGVQQGVSIAASFDDSDEDCGPRPSTAQRSIYTVAFPNKPTASLPCCTNKCYVTTCGATTLKHPHPLVDDLRSVASGKYDGSSTAAQMMLRKGAFYLQQPNIGNACADAGANNSIVDAVGGCPFIACRKCNYIVVRLQGAEWVDGDGTVDLYLTLRNFYPDWSRLASAYPVGQSQTDRTACVLRANPHAAAYCCQCSWLTVRGKRDSIETRLTDVWEEGNMLFATELPLVDGESRRPPLWICKGHAAV